MDNPNDIKLEESKAGGGGGTAATASRPTTTKDHLLKSKHIEYLMSFSNTNNTFDDDLSTDYLKMSGIFWVISGLGVCDSIAHLPADNILMFYRSCFDPISGGIAPSIGHDPHILSTLSAVQIIVLLKKRTELETNADAIVKYVRSLQNEDGSFSGDKWGEVDTRFSFCAIAILALLNRLDCAGIDVEAAVNYIRSCQNYDGGFGSRKNTESHAGLTYCCVGVLAITKSLDRIDRAKLVWWLSDRQCESGGFNGRPEKLPDVCYSWWVLASLRILDRTECISGPKLRKFILMCQDDESGGFADRPGNMVDPFHTLFGLGALSLLGNSNSADSNGNIDQLIAINPIFCMTSID